MYHAACLQATVNLVSALAFARSMLLAQSSSFRTWSEAVSSTMHSSGKGGGDDGLFCVHVRRASQAGSQGGTEA